MASNLAPVAESAAAKAAAKGANYYGAAAIGGPLVAASQIALNLGRKVPVNIAGHGYTLTTLSPITDPIGWAKATFGFGQRMTGPGTAHFASANRTQLMTLTSQLMQGNTSGFYAVAQAVSPGRNQSQLIVQRQLAGLAQMFGLSYQPGNRIFANPGVAPAVAMNAPASMPASAPSTLAPTLFHSFGGDQSAGGGSSAPGGPTGQPTGPGGNTGVLILLALGAIVLLRKKR